MTARVVIEREADTQIDLSDAWWRENRPASPNAFAEAFESAVRLLGDLPEAGALFFSRNVPSVRRLVLETGHSLYYRVQGQSQQKLVSVLVLRGPGQQPPNKLLP